MIVGSKTGMLEKATLHEKNMNYSSQPVQITQVGLEGPYGGEIALWISQSFDYLPYFDAALTLFI